MKKEWIPIMISTGKLKMKFIDLLTHYIVVLFFLIPITLNLFNYFQKHVLHNYKGVRSPEEMFIATLPFGIIAIGMYFVQNNRLKFKSVESNLSTDKLKEIIEQTAKELEWHTEIAYNKIIIAKTSPKWWTGSWGEQITIIFDNSRIMINSICDPDKKASIVSMGRNKKNINTLIENIKNASN